MKIGTILHYSLGADDVASSAPHMVGEVRPAIVVAVNSDHYEPDEDDAEHTHADCHCYSLQVFTNGRNDGMQAATLWKPAARMVDEPRPGCCHDSSIVKKAPAPADEPKAKAKGGRGKK